MVKKAGWKATLNAVLREHNKAAASGGKAVSYATQEARREILEQGFKTLRALGYKLPDVRGFKERHMMALGQAWEAKGLSAATLQNRMSVFRLFGEWIGKKGMIRGSEYYVKNPQRVARQLAASEDKTWSGKGMKLEDKLALIAAKDRYVAIPLELQRAFGLRMKEAALLKPHRADKGTYLAVNWGTKGGRERVLSIQTPYQQAVLQRAKGLVEKPTDSMVPAAYDFKSWKNHYYYFCHEAGISRKEGITSHGLRHERLNEHYQMITGQLSPIKGGLRQGVDEELSRAARQEIAEEAGHSRLSIAPAYLGSFKGKG